MLNLLRKIFIANYTSIQKESVRNAHGVFASIFGIVTNLIIVVLKLLAAFLIASKGHWIFPIALIADAINNLGDFASSLVTLIGFKLSKKPADKEHPFGHQRIEYIAGLIVAIFIVVAGFELAKSSIESILSYFRDSSYTSYDLFSIIVLAIAALLKALQSYVNYGLGKAIDSIALKNTGLDSLLDVISTLSVLLCALFSLKLHWNFLDGFIGLFISILLFYNGIKSIKEASSPLIGEANKSENIEKIKSLVYSHKDVYGVHDIVYHSYGANKNYISFHIEVDENLSLHEAHKIADGIEEEIKKQYHAEVTIHTDPSQRKNPIVHPIFHHVRDLVKEVSPKLSIHDFQIEGNLMSFDVLEPYGISIEEETITSKIKEAYPDYEIKINIDYPFAE